MTVTALRVAMFKSANWLEWFIASERNPTTERSAEMRRCIRWMLENGIAFEVRSRPCFHHDEVHWGFVVMLRMKFPDLEMEAWRKT